MGWVRIATLWRCVGIALLVVAGGASTATATVSLELKLARERGYPGESVPVTVTLRVRGARVRNIGYPRLDAPAGGTVTFAPPVQRADTDDPDGELYCFSGRISGSKPGRLTVGPARLDLEIMEGASGSAAFFGAIEPRPQTLATQQVTLDMLPLPAKGRPASFSGAVGSFSLAVATSPENSAVGDPLTITTTISGTGSLNSAGCPRITGGALRSYPPAARGRDKGLICEQVVIPSAAGQLPPVVWSYFDPGPGRYRTLRQALPDVSPQSGRTAPTTAPVLPAPPAPSRIQGASLLLLPAVLIGLTAVAFLIHSLRRYVVMTSSRERTALLPAAIEQSLAGLEQSLADNDVEKIYTVLFVLLQELSGIANDVFPAAVTGPLSNSAQSPSGQYAALTHLFRQCDRVRFGRFVPHEEEIRADLSLLRSMLQADHLSI